MAKEAVFTMKLEAELRDAFIAEAEAAHRPASQIVRDMMREYVDRQKEAREYSAFLHRKVELARGDVRAGRVKSNEQVSAEFAARRAKLVKKNSTAKS